MSVEHSEMLSVAQEVVCTLHILQSAKVPDNDRMDSRAIRLQNLQTLIKEAGGKAKLARATGLDEAMLSQFTMGVRGIGPKSARTLERKTGRKSGWLDVPHDGDPEIHRSPIMWVPAIEWLDAANPERIDGSTAMRPTNAIVGGYALSDRSFSLRVKDDSMVNPTGRHPTYPPGCSIIVDPDRAPQNADRVIVKIHGVDEPTFKVYTVDSGRVFLRSLNPQYPSLPWQSDMTVVGVVVQTVIDDV